MPFQTGTFMGSSVRDFKSSIGWGVGEPSKLVVTLVDDPANGDSFTPVAIGTPVYFQYYGFYFNGLLQNQQESNAIDGMPTYVATVVDPREILDGVQIIMGAYRGSVSGIYNLINAFGYWEANGFGASLTNEAGMPWSRVVAAVSAICNTPGYTAYGGPLLYRGNQYGLDLSQLPSPPVYYRMGTTSIGLLEAIAQICEDGGCDFFIELVGYTITVRTVSRLSQPPLGTISALAHTNTGNVIRTQSGLESRNEITSSFLVGGEKTTLLQTDSVRSFWGYDINGDAIWGHDDTLELKDKQGDVQASFTTEFMDLNASPVADLLGSVRYQCSEFELQCAKAGVEFWASYMAAQRTGLADAIGIVSSTTAMDPNITTVVKADAADVEPEKAKEISNLTVAPDKGLRMMRFYEFVKGYADEYMGRKFAIRLPFITRYEDPETLKVTASYDIHDAGYLDEGAQPLGLSEFNEDLFRNPDGRFRCFIEYTDIVDGDYTNVSPQGAVMDGDSLFVEAQVAPQILFDDVPYAIVTVPGVFTDLPADTSGNISDIEASLSGPGALSEASTHTFFPLKISPKVRKPEFAAIPLKSNLFTYGPWYAQGAPGKVKFEHDSGLTPWNYGDYATLNLAGTSRVATAVTNMQIGETGLIELASTPTHSLGQILQTGGPNLTNIDVSVGVQGFTTSYRFQTFTPRFGVFNKGMSERLKRIGLASQSLRRSLRASFRNNVSTNEVLATAARSSRLFMQNAPKIINKKSPHELFVAYSFDDGDGSGIRQTMSTSTYEEAIALSHAHDDAKYQRTAIMSPNGLFRTFSTASGENSYLSHFEAASVGSGTYPSLESLNPFKRGHDVESYAWGDDYRGLNGYRRDGDPENSRLFSLRAPLVLTGWGFGWDSKKYPSEDDGVNWTDDHLRHQNTWKTGPLDVLWCDQRKVWTCHDLIRGKTIETLPANGSGKFRVEGGGLRASGDPHWEIYMHNYFSTAVSGDVKCIGGYMALDNRMYVIAADCASG